MLNFLTRAQSRRHLKNHRVSLAAINTLGPGLVRSTSESLCTQAELLKISSSTLSWGELVVEGLTLARELAHRVMKMRPYDVQILGALALLDDTVAEMRTGEGKTLTAPLAAFVHFLAGRQVHIVTANAYLAERDATMMAPLYKALGMRVSVTRSVVAGRAKPESYAGDVVYGTASAFAQDYLADRLSLFPRDIVQGPLSVAIVDEADCVLIDEAKTPVVLTAVAPADEVLYRGILSVAKQLRDEWDAPGDRDFWIDSTLNQAVLSDAGYDRVTQFLKDENLLPADAPLYVGLHQDLLRRVAMMLSALHVLRRNDHYIVVNDRIVLIDALTGRMVPERRWDSGLQQSLQAKEGVPIEPEAQTLGSITLQNYFRLYEHLAGMTGTAMSEAQEFADVYGLEVVEIPPNVPSLRIDLPDRVFRTQAQRLQAVVEDIVERHAKEQPVLIGTASVEQSELLSKALSERGVPHQVLNARNHQNEARVLADAGRPGSVTVTTNMAGRGVDIVLGGSIESAIEAIGEGLRVAGQALTDIGLEVITARAKGYRGFHADRVRAAGGLHVIGMERYPSRRMDQQLRGRTARQGDPGSTCFYIAVDDELIERFAGDRIRAVIASLDIKPGEALEHKLLTGYVASAQRQMEGFNADVRRKLVQADSVLQQHRELFYQQRQAVLEHDEAGSQYVQAALELTAKRLAELHAADEMPENWDLVGLRAKLKPLGVVLPDDEPLQELKGTEWVFMFVRGEMEKVREARLMQVPKAQAANLERQLVLRTMDEFWFNHLAELEHLKKGIHLRAYANQKPDYVFQKEAFEMLETLFDELPGEVARRALIFTLA